MNIRKKIIFSTQRAVFFVLLFVCFTVPFSDGVFRSLQCWWWCKNIVRETFIAFISFNLFKNLKSAS